jgi:hypothetical protein
MVSEEGRGPQTDKTPAAKSLYMSIFKITTFGIALLVLSFYRLNNSWDSRWKVNIHVKCFKKSIKIVTVSAVEESKD